jgi:hypothetical protein
VGRGESRHSNRPPILLDLIVMSPRPNIRALVALAVAYALTLQAILLAFGASLGAQAGELGGLPICSSLHSGLASGLASGLGSEHSAPLGHAGDCPGTCLGCCCGPPACHFPGPAMTYAPALAPIIIVDFVAMPPIPVGPRAAHRSRAPPSA